MPKNTPEKIAELYLRLNGFFVMSHFTMLTTQGQPKHIDLVAIRPRGSKVLVNNTPLDVDDSFFKKLKVDKDDDNVAIVAEVKGGRTSHPEIDLNTAHKYMRSVVGPDFEKNLKKLAFCYEKSNLGGNNITTIKLKDCFHFIVQRLEKYRSEKSGSWYLSEDFLGDLIYLQKLGFLRNPR